jgi:hypothetical protein
VVEPGEEFKITIEAWDKWEQLAIQYNGKITLKDFIVNQTTGEIKEVANEKILQFSEQFEIRTVVDPKEHIFQRRFIDAIRFLIRTDGIYAIIHFNERKYR